MPRALLSVSDKTGIADLGRGLVARGFELVSTGVPEVAFRVAMIDGKVNFTVRGLKGDGGEE